MLSRVHHVGKRWPAARMLALAVVLLGLTDHSSLLQQVRAQGTEGVPTKNDEGDMECVSYCSVTRPGTSQMEVKWRLARQPMTEHALRSMAVQQGLEATVYAEGFERGQYVVVSTIKPQASFRPPGAATKVAPAGQPKSKLPGLEKLTIAEVATRLDKPRTFRLMAPTATDTSGEWVVVRLEGLNPGMQYTYRVPGSKSVIACQAAVCPVDRATPPASAKPKTSPTPR